MDVPDEMRLSDLHEGAGAADVEVQVLRGNGAGDIVDQYVRFCKISGEERKKHGRSRKAIEETLRWCIEENVLAPFLATRRKAVAKMDVLSHIPSFQQGYTDCFGRFFSLLSASPLTYEERRGTPRRSSYVRSDRGCGVLPI